MPPGAFGTLVERAVAHGQDGDVIVADVGIFLGADVQRKFRLQKSRNLILRRPVVDYDLVLGAIPQTHQDDVSSSIGDHGLLSGGDLGLEWIAQVGEEDALPVGDAGSGADILHVQDVILKVFVEDAGLNFK